MSLRLFLPPLSWTSLWELSCSRHRNVAIINFMHRIALIWIVVLHAAHVPLPVPDLDGECRGTPIPNLAASNAWHVLVLGVLPNNDIDQGPFRTRHNRGDAAPTQSPFGDSGLASVSVSATHSALGWLPLTPVIWLSLEPSQIDSDSMAAIQAGAKLAFSVPDFCVRSCALLI